MNARKAHNTGRNHVSNVRDYFASLGHDKAQNIIDAIISQHEGGGRAQMMAAPSMRIGAGFMNPMGPNMNMPPPSFAPPPGGYPPQGSMPPFRPPFAPQGGMMPPFPPPGGQGMPPFPPMGHSSGFTPPAVNGSPARPPANVPTSNFTPAATPPVGNPGIHPDRLRMLGI